MTPAPTGAVQFGTNEGQAWLIAYKWDRLTYSANCVICVCAHCMSINSRSSENHFICFNWFDSNKFHTVFGQKCDDQRHYTLIKCSFGGFNGNSKFIVGQSDHLSALTIMWPKMCVLIPIISFCIFRTMRMSVKYFGHNSHIISIAMSWTL